MKFFKKSKKAAKQGGMSLADKASRFADTPTLRALMAREDAEDSLEGGGNLNDRKADFLELLAKEERAHRIKLAEMRNEPITDRRSDRVAETREEMAAEMEAPIELPRPTEMQTRASIGRQIGGEDFLAGSNTGFNAPELTAHIPDDAEREDVTPPETLSKPLSKNPKPLPKTRPVSAQQTDTENTDNGTDMDYIRPAKTGHANVNELRLDVARITSDIENGDALYRRAQQRVQGLMHFVEKAEVDFSLLERIEPENRRLKARNALINKELEDAVRQSALTESDLDEHRRRLAEVHIQHDTVNGNLAKAMKALAERDREIRQLNNDISSTTLKLDREKTTTEVEIRENNVLRDRVVNLTNSLEDTKASRAQTSKAVESLKIDLEDHRTARDRLETESYDLRHTLDTAQKQNNQMKGEMVALHQDISTFKTQYEFNIISRDDRIALLETQIEDLARQVQIKDDIVASAARDVTDLRKSRTAGELERERLEKQIDGQSLQLDDAQKALFESQHAREEMDDRYRDVAAALSISQNQRSAQAPAKTPDIAPHNTREFPPMPSRNDGTVQHREDDFDELDEETIEDRIMDYKLGLRKNIF